MTLQVGVEQDVPLGEYRSGGRVYSERDYPSRGDHIRRGPFAIGDLNPTIVIDSFNKVGHNERAIAEVVRRQPVTAVVGSLPLRERFYTPGRLIRSSEAHGDTRLNHTVLIVGFGKKDGLDYWRYLNFWGATFGGDETFYLERNMNHSHRNVLIVGFGKKKTDWTIGDVLISGVQLLVAMRPFIWRGIRIIPIAMF
ncbi:putative cathepsin H [Helianthus anomalus]